jgi:ATP-binding cassette subfamily E protein 1
MDEETVVFDEAGKPIISEVLCTGCGICIKKCPYKAITIINIPDELETDLTHRFGENAFKLFRLPVVRPGAVTGLIGENSIGKSTALKILAGQITPNLGKFTEPPTIDEVIESFKGSELHNFFINRNQSTIKVVFKPQYITKLPSIVKGDVGSLLEKSDERGAIETLKEDLSLTEVWDRDLSHLSGGELQRVAIAATAARNADLYLFDEPSSYLDVRERLKMSQTIQHLTKNNKMVCVVEHDLAVLDYLSDYVCVLYGKPRVYGVVSHPHGVRVGINIYLNGYIPDENMRFRRSAIAFHDTPVPVDQWREGQGILAFTPMKKSFDGFSLTTKGGELFEGEVIGILGPNGIGKTTFVNLLAGTEDPDEGEPPKKKDLKVSVKPQYLSHDTDNTVEKYLTDRVGSKTFTSVFNSEFLVPLTIDQLLDREIRELSGGELQRVAIAACMGVKSDLYLLDEPSAFLDVEQRLAAAKVIKRTILSQGKTAFVVEHDIVVQDFISDRLIVFDGTPGIEGFSSRIVEMREGMNAFLKRMEVTFRRDGQTKRPRVNKRGSRLDREQRDKGEYYYSLT